MTTRYTTTRQRDAWTPVDVALPLHSEYVLVCEVTAEAPIEVARHVPGLEMWLAVDSFILQCVTHWQPLPELPLDNAPGSVVE